jgi:hypothetical protein
MKKKADAARRESPPATDEKWDSSHELLSLSRNRDKLPCITLPPDSFAYYWRNTTI